MHRRCFNFGLIPFLILMTAGCAGNPDVIPESLEPQIDKTLSFSQVVADPYAYRGKTVVLGGEVLKAKGGKDGTQLEILQLPLQDSLRPVSERTESRGRFIAINKEFVDPATFVDGTPVTVVAEITGATTQRLDETEYRYPTVEIKHLHVWDAADYDNPASRPWFGVFGGVGVGGGRTGGGGGVSIGTGF